MCVCVRSTDYVCIGANGAPARQHSSLVSTCAAAAALRGLPLSASLYVSCQSADITGGISRPRGRHGLLQVAQSGPRARRAPCAEGCPANMPRASSDAAVGLDRLLELLGQIDEGTTLKRQEVKAISLECTVLPDEQAWTSDVTIAPLWGTGQRETYPLALCVDTDFRRRRRPRKAEHAEVGGVVAVERGQRLVGKRRVLPAVPRPRTLPRSPQIADCCDDRLALI